MKNLSYLLSLLFFSLVSTTHSQNKTEGLFGKKVLIVYGGWEGHQPKIFADKISLWLKNQGAKVQLADSTSIYTNTELLNGLDLIIQHITMSKMTDKQSHGLISAIASGVGLAGCHGGLGDSFRENTEYQYMVGGQFVKHPGGQVSYTVKMNNTEDPIIKGINDFSLFSEQYYMHVDSAIEVLATTQFSGEHDSWIAGVEVPVVWKKAFGKGRVYYNAIGHSEKDFEIPEVWNLITRGVLWAAQKD